MMGTILAWTAPLVALCALVGLWRSTDLATRRIWRAVAVVTALGSTTVMALIALPAEPEQASFLVASGMATALLYGAGLWLGLSALLVDEYRRPAISKRRRGESALWDDIARELTSCDSLDAMLLNIAGVFRRDVAADCAHVYKISMNRGAAYRTGTVYSQSSSIYTGAANMNPVEQGHLLAELAWWAAQEDQPAIVNGADGTPVLTLPLRDDGTIYAIILIQNPQRAMPADWLFAAAMVARTISQWSELAEHRDRGVISQRMTALMPRLMNEQRIEAALSVIGSALRGVVEYDYLSISSMGASRSHEDRATMLAGSGRVIENRRGWPVAGATLHRVLSTGRAVITPDLDMAGDDDECDNTSWERRLGMRSRLIAPIRAGQNVIGTLTIAHRRFAHYSETEADLIPTLSAFLAPWLRGIDSTRRVERLERVLGIVRQFEARTPVQTDDATMVREADLALDATGLRVYRIDERRQILGEVASSGRLRDGARELPLTQLPWHRWALDSRRTLSIDQGDPESLMSAKEASLAMDKNMKTGFLVPIVAGGRPLGVIDVIERRDPDRNALDEGGKLVVEKLAAILAEKWSMALPECDDVAVAETMGDRLKGWSRMVVNPLTCIIGSVELIRHKEQRLTAETIKYLGTIERSATRIHESLTKIIEEAAAAEGEGGIMASQDRWTCSRPREQMQMAVAEFARPASLSEAAMRRAGIASAPAGGAAVPVTNDQTHFMS